jgi:hypothetical protein
MPGIGRVFGKILPGKIFKRYCLEKYSKRYLTKIEL